MIDNINIEEIKEQFWQKIRPRTKEEVEEEAMIIKVKDHYNKLMDDLLNEDGVNYKDRLPKGQKLVKLKEELNNFISKIKEKE